MTRDVEEGTKGAELKVAEEGSKKRIYTCRQEARAG
jgi:hypothetical protein